MKFFRHGTSRFPARAFLPALFVTVFSVQVWAQTEVVVTSVREVALSDPIEGLGDVFARQSVDIQSTLTERVLKVAFSDGQRVEAWVD